MTWFDLVKISTEHAIRDVEEFAPEMIAEQKKLDEEEKDRALELVRTKQEEAYLVPFDQLPRIKDFKTTSTRSSGWRERRYKGRHGYIAPAQRGEQFTNYSSFLDSYIPYFLTDAEFKEYKTNKRDILKWRRKFRPEEFPSLAAIYYELDHHEPTAKDNQELKNMKNRNIELNASAMFRWGYYILRGQVYPKGWMNTEPYKEWKKRPFDNWADAETNWYDKKLREELEE